MTIYVSCQPRKLNSVEIDVCKILNDSVCDAAVSGSWAYLVSQHGSNDPVRFIGVSVITGFVQPLLSFSLDDIFKKKANFLSPILSTAFGYGLSLGTQYALNRISLSDDARFYAITSVAYLALIKGVTRKTFNTSIYPSLASLVTVPLEGTILLCEGISSLFSRAVNSQFVRSKTDAVYWAFNRFRENPCQDPEREPKEV